MSKLEQAANSVVMAMPGGRVFDPTTILTIVDIIAQLIERCREKKADEFKASAAKPNIIERLIVRRTVRNELDRNDWRSFGQDVVQAIFDTGSKTELADIQAIIDEVATL